MYNFNGEIFKFLNSLCKTYNGYPTNWNTFPCISFTCENNDMANKCDDKEFTSYIAYKIDIFNKSSNYTLITKINDYFVNKGFTRRQCKDIPDNSGLVHTVMRFDIYVDRYGLTCNKI